MKQNTSRTANVALNLCSGMLGQILSIIVRFVTRTVFINTLGSVYLGINGLFSDILNMLSLTELGFSTAVVYRMYKPLRERDDRRIRVLLKFYKRVYRDTGVIVLLLGLCIIPLLPKLIRDYDSLALLGIDATLLYLLYLVQSAMSYLFFAYCRSVMEASQKKYYLDLAEYLVRIVQNAIQIALLVLLKSFIIYTAVSLFFVIVKNCVNAMIAKYHFPQFFIEEDTELEKNEVREVLRDCMALFVYKVNNVVLKATDNVLLSKFIGLKIVGVYSNYLLFYVVINSILDYVQNAIKHSMGDLFAAEGMETKYRFFKVVGFINFVLYGTAAVGIAICANELITVWIGAEYVIPQPFPILIGLELLSKGIIMTLGMVRNTAGVFQQMWFRPLISSIVNLAVSLALIGPFGIYGVIVGTISAYLLVYMPFEPALIYKYCFEKKYKVSEYYLDIGKKALVLLGVFFLDLWVCSHLLLDMGWIMVAAHVALVGISFPSLYFLLYRRTEECRYIMSHTKLLLNKFAGRRRNG